MAGIIKNQILKHLSRFTKNLSPSKINVSTLKGEGNLSNLELDELVLTDLLDLPTWLKISRASCNKVSIKIQWTKLKSQPICLYLDEIVVEMETCETPRMPTSLDVNASYSSGGKYGFAERIIDGMFVSINSVVVNFKARTFAASIQLSRILVQSKTPLWQNGDLRLTRIKDDLRGEILIFKEAEWQTLRIEANAMEGSTPSLSTTPLRLIANQSKIRISIKKRLIDCGMVASRLQVNLDDLLWVLTDSQLNAALGFINSLQDVIKKSNLQSKQLAAEKLKMTSPTHNPAQPRPPTTANMQQMNYGTKSQQSMSRLFTQFDMIETSYHLYTGRVDLHLCDDAAPDDETYCRKVEGGAMQITLFKMAFDYYPYHPAGNSDRGHWVKYDENMGARDAWVQDLLSTFKEDVRTVRDFYTSPKTSPLHKNNQAPLAQQQQQQNNHQLKSPQAPKSVQKVPKQTKLLESCVVFRLEDFSLYRVSTASDHKRSTPKKFLSSDKRQLLLPPEMSSIHADYTEYYFPEGIDFPVPASNLYVVLNPIRLMMDFLTVLWLNAFTLNLLKKADLPQQVEPKQHVDIKINALMPRIILPAEEDQSNVPERPEALQIQISRLMATNCRLDQKASVNELSASLDAFNAAKLYASRRKFPQKSTDLLNIPDSFCKHANKNDSPYFDKTVESVFMRTDSFKLDAAKDVWCVAIDQIWAEFLGLPNTRSRPVPFVESFPIVLWFIRPTPPAPVPPQHWPSSSSLSQTEADKAMSGQRASTQDIMTDSDTDLVLPPPALADAHALIRISSRVNVQITHYQYVFLMRLIETLTANNLEMEQDSTFIRQGPAPSASMSISLILSEAEIALICPAIPELPSILPSHEDSDDLKDVFSSEVRINGGIDLPPASECVDSALGNQRLSLSLSNTSASQLSSLFRG
ncbi:hypothetical protein CAPTEDRAFT_105822 [Capitella teleta]|uniref:Uncharacterized protein n=1 Tax=Capitella teleta TaxID=283909 RepID=R7V169_CAPTE|nr:hypothetical protein CAPTEDRAFT_105822 [Capitella teleta]|eukprot:ELU09962.1 hypothetical protein CAPTEDRAFT_105822 [Capitella teleta]